MRYIELKAAQPDGMDLGRLVSHEIAEGVGGVIAANAVVVRIDLEDILRARGVVLERGDGFNETRAA